MYVYIHMGISCSGIKTIFKQINVHGDFLLLSGPDLRLSSSCQYCQITPLNIESKAWIFLGISWVFWVIGYWVFLGYFIGYLFGIFFGISWWWRLPLPILSNYPLVHSESIVSNGTCRYSINLDLIILAIILNYPFDYPCDFPFISFSL